MHVLIVGAGIVGMATAHRLSGLGHQVTVIDREAEPGRAGSYRNGGQFSYSYAEPLAAPGLWFELPALLWQRDSPLSIRLAGLPGLLAWGPRLLRNCTRARFAAHTASVLRLALLSRAELERFLATAPEPFGFRATGKLHLYFEPQRFRRAEALVRLKQGHGVRQELWSAAECRRREPALRQLPGTLEGGVYSPLDQSGDTFRLVQALVQASIRSGRCRVRPGVEVQAVRIEGGGVAALQTSAGALSADAYVVCAGADTADLLRPAGDRLPVIPVKGYSVSVPARPDAPLINLTDTRHRVVYARLDDQLRIAGTVEFAGRDRRVREPPVARLLAIARATLPQAGAYDQPLASWAGLRPMTPDGVPVIGPGRWPGLWINGGHGMLGTTLALGSARLLGDLLEGVAPPIDPAPYSPRRF